MTNPHKIPESVIEALELVPRPADGGLPENMTLWDRPVVLVPLDRIQAWRVESTDEFFERVSVTIFVGRVDNIAKGFRREVLNAVDPTRDREDD